MKNLKFIIITIMLLLTLAIFSDVAIATPPDKNAQLTPSEFTDGGHLYLIWEHDTIYCTELSNILHESGSTVYKYDKTTGLVEFTYNPELPDMFNDFFYINNGDWIGGSVGTANMPFSNTMIPLNPKLGIFVYDNDEDTMTVVFSTNASGSWEIIETFENVVSNTFVECGSITGVSEYNTMYWIRVSVSDGIDSFEDTNWFVTIQMPYIEPSNTYVDDNQISSWYDNAHVKTIQEGIDNATTGQTVYVHNGIYSENDILVNKALNIIGEHRNNVIVNDLLATNNVFYIISDNVNISNFTIYATDSTGKSGCLFEHSNFSTISNCNITSMYRGVYVTYSEGVTVENCIINDTQMDGIRFRYDSPYGRIYNSTINTYNSSNSGIRLSDNSPNVIINNCIIYGSMIFSYSGFQTVTNCNIYHNDLYAVTTDSSPDNIYDNINIYNTTYGFQTISSNNIVTTNCNLYNVKYGFYISNSPDGIYNNINIYNSTTGYKMMLSDNTIITNCNLYTVKNGFWLSHSADSVHVKDCNLIGHNTSVGYGVILYYDGGSPYDCIFEDMTISNFNTGFYIYGYSSNTTVNNLNVYDCDTAFCIKYADDNHFSNLTINNCSGDGFGIYYDVNNNTLKDSTINNVVWGLYEGWAYHGSPEYTTFYNVTVTNSTYGITLDSAYHDNSVYQYLTIKNNDYGVVVEDYYEYTFCGNIIWDETNLVYNNNLDYYIQNNASINIFSNYLFDSNIENDVTDSEPYVNYHHVNNSGLKEFNTAKMMANCSIGESAKITILDNNLTMWSVNQTSGSIYQKLGGFEVNSEYQVKFDGIFLHYYTATTDTMLESSTGVIYANYSDDWSSHIFTIEMDELIFPPIISTCLYKYVGFAVFIIICIALIMWGFTSKKRIRVRKIKYR